MSASEFAITTSFQSDRRSPVRWVLSHVLRNRIFILTMFLGAFGNAALAALVPVYIGRAFDAAVASVISAFYYLRIVYFMYFGEEGEDLDSKMNPVLWTMLMGSAAVMLLGVVNLFGIEPIAAAAAATLVN